MILASLLRATLLMSGTPAPPREEVLLEAVHGLGRTAVVAHNVQALKVLGESPAVSAGYLVDELRVLQPTPTSALSFETTRDDPLKAEGLHLVWCVRALRYITGGLNFRASTTYQFGHDERERKYHLVRGSREEMPFFATWMSRDVVYLAPADVQGAIIAKWREWYRTKGKVHSYRAAPSHDDWYF